MESIYNQLREALDKLSVGYPEAEGHIEIKLLEKLFTEEEANLFIGMSPFLETSEEVAERLGRDNAETDLLLEKMVRKGLLFMLRNEGSVRYATVPYVPGIFEFQVKRMDIEFARLHEEYFELELSKSMQSVKTPILRTIPIRQSLMPGHTVAPYEDVLKIIEGQQTIAVAPCVCRTQTGLVDGRCQKSIENCFQFGALADYFVENGMGRYVDKDEVRKILADNEREGFVMQPHNSKKMGALCSCCGDCCEVLRSLKMSPKPVEEVNSNYFAALEKASCSACETCLERCQMDAISVQDGTAEIDLDRCIGCGLCVSTCPEDAIQLFQKPLEKLYVPPKNTMEAFMRIAEERNFF